MAEPDRPHGALPDGKSPAGPPGAGPVIPKLIIGLVVPFVAICLLIPVVNDVEVNILNIPFIFIWMFAWFILTSVCLAICWFGFDRYRTDETFPDTKPDASA